jgi:hypothetical protein
LQIFDVDIDYFNKRAISKTNIESKIVDANGKEKTRPRNLNRKSPGKRPMPSFSSQGSKNENTINATKITKTHLIIARPFASIYILPHFYKKIPLIRFIYRRNKLIH